MGLVYLINSGLTDRYKIGISKNPSNRIRGLQTGNPMKLTLTDFYESENYEKIELVLHRTLKHKKYIPEDFESLKGEWFILTQDDVDNFKQMCKKIEDAMNYLKENSTLGETKK